MPLYLLWVLWPAFGGVLLGVLWWSLRARRDGPLSPDIRTVSILAVGGGFVVLLLPHLLVALWLWGSMGDLTRFLLDVRYTLPLVVGKGAETQARDFLALLARYPQVSAVTKAAIYVGERRWNLRLKDGLDVRLPEQDVGNALAKLSRLDKEDRLFSRDIVAVDMRLPDRLVVQLSEDAAKAREELFKDKKKKKAGDSA